MPRRSDAADALRASVVVTRLDHVHVVRLTGADAARALGRLAAGVIRARDGQVQHVLLLNERARCLADGFVLCDDEAFDLIYEGPTPAAMLTHIAAHLPQEWDVTVEDRSVSHALLGMDGPFAWELVSRIVGAEAVGLPYLTFFHAHEFCCIRSGKTGEYGYSLLLPRGGLDALEARALAEGASLDAAPGTLEVLDTGALECFFFNIRGEGRADVTPIELQLQWRVSYDGDGIGLPELRRHRSVGFASRVTTLLTSDRVAVGDEVRLHGACVGSVLNAGWSPSRKEWVALALLELACALPGIGAFKVSAAAGPVNARSVSPPTLNNASLFVSPQMHSYATRAEISLPRLVR